MAKKSQRVTKLEIRSTLKTLNLQASEKAVKKIAKLLNYGVGSNFNKSERLSMLIKIIHVTTSRGAKRIRENDVDLYSGIAEELLSYKTIDD